jgi:hypothetical protein
MDGDLQFESEGVTAKGTTGALQGELFQVERRGGPVDRYHTVSHAHASANATAGARLNCRGHPRD